MAVYEITAAGFDGGSSITEDRVIWVKTFDGAKEDLQIMCDEADAEFCGELNHLAEGEEGVIDFDLTTGLTAYGELRAVLAYFNRRRADA